MKTDEKIEILEKSMQSKQRKDDTYFTCFSDTAPKELIDLFLEHYEVRDVDYQIFSKAIDAITEAYNNNGPELLEDYIRENYNDFSSPYNADRLAYLSIWNDSEIAQILKENECKNVSEACAIWYDNQVQIAASRIINNYLLK